MKLKSILSATLLMSSHAFAVNICPNLSGHFHSTSDGTIQDNIQIGENQSTVFIWAGLLPVVLDGHTENGIGYIGHCEDGSRIVFSIESPGAPAVILTLKQTSTGYEFLINGTHNQNFDR